MLLNTAPAGIPSSVLAPLTLVMALVLAAPTSSTASPSSLAASASPTDIARVSSSFRSSISSLASSFTVSNKLSNSSNSELVPGCLFINCSSCSVIYLAFSNNTGVRLLTRLVTTSSVLDDIPDNPEFSLGAATGGCLCAAAPADRPFLPAAPPLAGGPGGGLVSSVTCPVWLSFTSVSAAPVGAVIWILAAAAPMAATASRLLIWSQARSRNPANNVFNSFILSGLPISGNCSGVSRLTATNAFVSRWRCVSTSAT